VWVHLYRFHLSSVLICDPKRIQSIDIDSRPIIHHLLFRYLKVMEGHLIELCLILMMVLKMARDR